MVFISGFLKYENPLFFTKIQGGRVLYITIISRDSKSFVQEAITIVN